MMLRRVIYLTLVLLVSTPIFAQEEDDDVQLNEAEIITIVEEMSSYISEVVMLQSSIPKAKVNNISSLENRLLAIDNRWQNYTALKQQEIGTNETLSSIASQYQQLFTTTMDSISTQQKILLAQTTFSTALTFILHNSGQYSKLHDNAVMYSLVPQTAKQLAEVKAQEQLLFQEMAKNYQKALDAIDVAPKLQKRKAELERAYITVKLQSDEIQAMAYKNMLERIKDYVMTFAGIAILIMFVTMVMSKISALKTARDAAKKVAESMNKKDYPTI